MTKYVCEVSGCINETTRIPHVCTKHFIEGWGRLPDMPLPQIPVQEIEDDGPTSGKVVPITPAKKGKK